MRTIAIFGPEESHLSSFTTLPSYRLYTGIVQQAQLADFNTVRLGIHDLTDQFLKKALRGEYCGLLMYTPPLQSDPRLLQLKKNSIPIVVEGCVPGKIGLDSVMPNHQAGCYDLTRLLIEKGYRRILRCWGVPDRNLKLHPAGIHWIAHRNLGYEQAIRESRLELLPPLEIIFPSDNQLRITQTIFKKRVELAAEHLKPLFSASTPIDAILTSNDVNSFEIAAACRKLGLKPNQDIPITGYDNNWNHTFKREWENFIPFATIDKQDEKVGAKMVDILIERLNKKLSSNLVDIMIPPKLVIPNQDSSTT